MADQSQDIQVQTNYKLTGHKITYFCLRPAQELLKSICLNCTTATQLDVDVMVQLIKQRLKTKQTITLFLSCLKDLCGAHPDNLATILKHTIFNELSNAR